MRDLGKPRKEPRINLRFSSHEAMDRYELEALRQGQTLAQWLKRLAENATSSQQDRKLERLMLESVLLIRAYLEMIVPEENHLSAKERVRRHLGKDE